MGGRERGTHTISPKGFISSPACGLNCFKLFINCSVTSGKILNFIETNMDPQDHAGDTKSTPDSEDRQARCSGQQENSCFRILLPRLFIWFEVRSQRFKTKIKFNSRNLGERNQFAYQATESSLLFLPFLLVPEAQVPFYTAAQIHLEGHTVPSPM